MIVRAVFNRVLTLSLCLLACGSCARKPEPPLEPGTCRETRYECDSCSSGGILGSRHIHKDCSVTCDMICGRKEGY
jgi:hypothetical protein